MAIPMTFKRSLHRVCCGINRMQVPHKRYLARKRAEERFPFLVGYKAKEAKVLHELELSYLEYVSQISTESMAVSLPTAMLLRVVCEATTARRVLDVGSGYSSFLFRAYSAKYPGTSVVSVDDDQKWLDITRRYIVSKGLNADGLITWQDFCKSPGGAYDLIFYDLGRMPLRIASLNQVLQLAEVGRTLIVLDDVHKPDYASFVFRQLKKCQGQAFDLSYITMDRFGRWSMIVSDVKFSERLR